jgi:hypothetical protein
MAPGLFAFSTTRKMPDPPFALLALERLLVLGREGWGIRKIEEQIPRDDSVS